MEVSFYIACMIICLSSGEAGHPLFVHVPGMYRTKCCVKKYFILSVDCKRYMTVYCSMVQ